MSIKTIKTRLFLFSVGILSLSLLLGLTGYYSITKILKMYEFAKDLDNVKSKIKEIELYEKEFLLYETSNPAFYEISRSEKSTLIDKNFNWIFNKLKQTNIENNYKDFSFNTDLSKLSSLINQYSKKFNQLVEIQLIKGYKDWGEIGKMRSIIHKVEDSKAPYNRAEMLMLRRHEKDFLIRKETKYKQKFDAQISVFLDSLEVMRKTNPAYKSEIAHLKKDVLSYQAIFDQVVLLEQKLGTSQQEGIRGDLNKTFDEISNILPGIITQAEMYTENSNKQTIALFFIVFIVQITLGLAFGILFGKSLSERIVKTKNYVSALASGEFSEQYDDNGSDELSQAVKAIKKLTERIKTAAGFAEQIGNNNLDVEYDQSFRKGLLEQALVKMQQNLKMFQQEENQRNWVSGSLATLNETIRQNQESLENLLRPLTKALVQSLQANQAGIFVIETNLDNGKKQLALKACYAYDRQKYLNKKVNIGEGLLGQIALEKKMQILDEVPDNYANITSGLGQSRPRTIALIPLITNQQMYGVLEIASFKAFNKFQIELLERSSETLASAIRNLRLANGQTEEMLDADPANAVKIIFDNIEA